MSAVVFESLKGLDRDRIVAVVGPILAAHGVQGVELRWRTDRGEWVLDLTVERPETREPGHGITLELCSEISRDLSAALDVADVIPMRYRLQVGSPGLERALYVADDYARFAGQRARLKLSEPVDGQRVVRGTLHGLDEAGRVLVETERGELGIELETIERAQLLFEWTSAGHRAGKGQQPGRRASGHGQPARRSKRGR